MAQHATPPHTMFGRLQYGHRAARWSSAEGMEQALGFAHTADEIRSWRHQQQLARRKTDLRRQQLAPLIEKEKGSEYRKAVLANLPESIHTARTWLEFWREHAGGGWEGRPADAPYRMLNAQANLVSVSPRMKPARSPRTAVEILQQAPSVSDYADTEITVAWAELEAVATFSEQLFIDTITAAAKTVVPTGERAIIKSRRTVDLWFPDLPKLRHQQKHFHIILRCIKEQRWAAAEHRLNVARGREEWPTDLGVMPAAGECGAWAVKIADRARALRKLMQGRSRRAQRLEISTRVKQREEAFRAGKFGRVINAVLRRHRGCAKIERVELPNGDLLTQADEVNGAARDYFQSAQFKSGSRPG